MKRIPRWLIVCMAAMFFAAGGRARADEAALAPPPLRTLHVSPRGSDDHDGLSESKALRTISKAATMVRPGDLVLVAGGIYREQVQLKIAGTAEHPIVFQAAPGQTALVTWQWRAEKWERFAEARNCYAAAPGSAVPEPRFVWEDATLTEYTRVYSMQDLEAMPASYHFDADAQRLIVHPLAGLSPAQAGIVAVPLSAAGINDRTAPAKGFWIKADYNQVKGFTIAYQPIGIDLEAGHGRVARNTVYGCLVGIWAFHGHDSVIEANTCFRNINNGINLFSAKDMLVQDNTCKHNGNRGPTLSTDDDLGLAKNMSLYRSCENATLRGNTIIADDVTEVWRYKSLSGKSVTEGNVIVGGNAEVNANAVATGNTIIGGTITEIGGGPLTPEALAKDGGRIEGNLELPAVRPEDGFANPYRHDYRLNAHSPHLGKGAHPQAAKVYYISPTGDDKADGQSPATAWLHFNTLDKAEDSATIFLMPGIYKQSMTLEGNHPLLIIQSYQPGTVILDGEGKQPVGIHIQRTEQPVMIDGLIIRGFTEAGIKVEQSLVVSVDYTVIHGGKTGISAVSCLGLSLSNNTFHECTQAASITGAVACMDNNLLSNIGRIDQPVAFDLHSKAEMISERNGFCGPNAGAQLKTWTASVTESHPSLLIISGLTADYRPDALDIASYGGANHKLIGAFEHIDARPIPVEQLVVRQATAERAIITWRTPEDYPNATVNWSTNGAVAGTLAVPQDRGNKKTSGSAVLMGLKPGTKYDLTLAVTLGTRHGEGKISFTTPQTLRPPTTLYVAPTGSDADTGLDATRPLRTLMAASYSALPGDTILVSPGVYHEHVILFTGGLSEDKPLVFRSVKPGEAIIDGGKIRSSGIWVLPVPGSDTAEQEQATRDWVKANNMAVSHLVIDGFTFRNMKYDKGGNHVVLLNDATDVRFENNVYRVAPGSMIKMAMQLNNCRQVRIRNNTFVNAIGFIEDWWGRSNDIVIDHNIFQGPGKGIGGNYVVYLMHTGPDTKFRVTNNVFASPLQYNKSQPVVWFAHPGAGAAPGSGIAVVDYNLYWRDQETAKPYVYRNKLVGFRDDSDKPKEANTIEEVRQFYGWEEHGKYADPLYADPYRGDFHLKPGSPAIGMSEEGSTVGVDMEKSRGKDATAK